MSQTEDCLKALFSPLTSGELVVFATDTVIGLGCQIYRPDLIKKICSLKTERLEIHYKKYLLVIDKNYFRDKVDYNVEVESFSRKAAQLYLVKKTAKFGVTFNKGYVSKSRRAIYNL